MDKTQLQKDLVSGDYEVTPEGLYFPREKLRARGVWTYAKRGEPFEEVPNLIVDEGLDYMLGAALGAQTPVTSWYIAIFTGDVAVQASWTAANFVSNATEGTAYVAASRPAWTPAAVSGQGISSFASKAEFVGSGVMTVRGAALLSGSVKSSTSGTLYSAARFNTDKGIDATEALDVGYRVELSSA